MNSLITSIMTTFGAETGTCSCIDTSLFGQICSDGTGQEIFMILALVINIMTVGIGILAAIGITVFGIQWLTSSGDSAKLTKAKSRLFNIVIGLVFYVLSYAFLQFLLPGGVFNPNDVNFENCTPTTPSDPGGGSSGGGGGSGGSGGGTTPAPSPTPTFNRLCGPETPGELGSLSEPNPKYDSDGSTLSAAGNVNYLTRKYTTLHGRVYYIFVQQNRVWADEPVSPPRNMANNGCRRTSYATILRSYGADVTPKNFPDNAPSVQWWLTQSPTSQLSVSVSEYNYDERNPNEYINKIWDTLQKGGAVIIQAALKYEEPSVLFFKPKCKKTNDCQHNMPIVDWRVNNGIKEVYFLDTRPKNNMNNTVGWHKLSDVLEDLKKRVKVGRRNYITMYTPRNQIDCMP